MAPSPRKSVGSATKATASDRVRKPLSRKAPPTTVRPPTAKKTLNVLPLDVLDIVARHHAAPHVLRKADVGTLYMRSVLQDVAERIYKDLHTHMKGVLQKVTEAFEIPKHMRYEFPYDAVLLRLVPYAIVPIKLHTRFMKQIFQVERREFRQARDNSEKQYKRTSFEHTQRKHAIDITDADVGILSSLPAGRRRSLATIATKVNGDNIRMVVRDSLRGAWTSQLLGSMFYPVMSSSNGKTYVLCYKLVVPRKEYIDRDASIAWSDHSMLAASMQITREEFVPRASTSSSSSSAPPPRLTWKTNSEPSRASSAA